ncbi:hypothetical protein C7J99_10185, partial [Brevibacillus brevis]
LWTRFRFLHGVVQSIPQGVALESERFLLFPPQHYSNNCKVFSKWLRWREEYFQSRLQAPSCWGSRLPAPKGFAGKRKSGSRYVAWARCVSFARESLLHSVGLHKSLRLEIFFSSVLHSFKAFKTRLTRKARRGNRRNKRRS